MAASNVLRIVVVGPTGRMGQQLCQRITAAADMELVATIGRPGEGGATAIAAIDWRGVDVLVDFSHRDAVTTHAALCAAHGVAWVLGTTGLGAAEQAEIGAAAMRTLVFQAANFSVGVALLRSLVAQAAQALGVDADIEIVESHHHHKVDAPSGTALALAEAAATARGQRLADVVRHGRHGLVGPRVPGEIGMHALRLGEVVGHHQVHLATATEALLLQHDARDRGVFADGALRAARWCAARRGLGAVGLVGMEVLVPG